MNNKLYYDKKIQKLGQGLLSSYNNVFYASNELPELNKLTIRSTSDFLKEVNF